MAATPARPAGAYLRSRPARPLASAGRGALWLGLLLTAVVLLGMFFGDRRGWLGGQSFPDWLPRSGRGDFRLRQPLLRQLYVQCGRDFVRRLCLLTIG